MQQWEKMSNDEIVTKANHKKIKMLETDEMFFVHVSIHLKIKWEWVDKSKEMKEEKRTTQLVLGNLRLNFAMNRHIANNIANKYLVK